MRSIWSQASPQVGCAKLLQDGAVKCTSTEKTCVRLRSVLGPPPAFVTLLALYGYGQGFVVGFE